MKELSQERAPIYEALERFNKMRVVPFDVPGHKRGRGNPELTRLLGESCIRLDVNSMKPLDNLCHPVSVIREAEDLAAEVVHDLQPGQRRKLINIRLEKIVLKIRLFDHHPGVEKAGRIDIDIHCVIAP